MKILLFTIEIIVSILLILLVLLHSPKGEGLAGIGGQARLFSSTKGLETGLNRLTLIIAAVFLITAGILSLIF